MNNSVKYVALLPLFFLSASYADVDANLKIMGTVKPPTCSINNGDESDIEYKFTVSPQMFPTTGNLRLTPETKRIEIVCDATTILNFMATDNRSDSVLLKGSANLFGLGKYGADDSKNIGYYSIKMKNATTKANNDAEETKVGISSDSDFNATQLGVNFGRKIFWASKFGQFAAAQIFAADFEVIPVLNGALKDFSGDVSLDGHATLAFSFSI
ncbi:type 1 fimbrial protein [Providencia stuartii]|uniref:fimbrial protein n=1 Tax=Providencia stuartii TaxID=588 RepID=UPI001FF2AEDE|nr:fimbrial protein [Providencia stuartii]ELZ5939954.1 type 1 fimbrial protein [Providencia stuartii]MCK1145041.1 fimbrial protein [Providencia stuartii]